MHEHRCLSLDPCVHGVVGLHTFAYNTVLQNCNWSCIDEENQSFLQSRNGEYIGKLEKMYKLLFC